MCASHSSSGQPNWQRLTASTTAVVLVAKLATSIKLLVTLFLVTAFCVQPSFGQSYSGRVLNDNPIFYWTLDDEDLLDPPTNLGVSELDAIYSGSIQLGQPGLLPGEADNKSAKFRPGSRIQIPDHPDIDDTAMAKKSWSAWFNVDDANSDNPQMIFEQGGNTRGAAIYVQGGQIFAGVWNNADDDGGVSSPWQAGDGDLQATIYLSAPVTSGVNNHIALVMDGSNSDTSGTVSAYLNGMLIGTETGAGQLFPHNPSNIGVCTADCRLQSGNSSGAGSDYSGFIDEVALFNTALTVEQILAHLDVTFPTPGDFNSDGQVSAADFTILAENFNTKHNFPAAISLGDINGDNTISMQDFFQFREIFQSQPAGAAAVPEPSTGILALFAIVVFPWIRRARHSH